MQILHDMAIKYVLKSVLVVMSFCQDTVPASELKYSLESSLTCLVLLPEAALKRCSYEKVFSKSSMQESMQESTHVDMSVVI